MEETLQTTEWASSSEPSNLDVAVQDNDTAITKLTSQVEEQVIIIVIINNYNYSNKCYY